jgi:hypothetical protein
MTTPPVSPTGTLPYGLQWPVKGSPRPTVRGVDPFETLLATITGYIARAPLNNDYSGLLNDILGKANGIYLDINPDAMKQGERLALINGYAAQGAAGIPGLLTYCFDQPSHPKDTTELAAWEAVENGYVPPSS